MAATTVSIEKAEAAGILDVEGTKKLSATERYAGWKLRGGEGVPPWWRPIKMPPHDLCAESVPIEYEREDFIWKRMLTEGKRQRLAKWRKQGGTGDPPWYKPAKAGERAISHAAEDHFWHKMHGGAHQFRLWGQ